MGHIVSLLIMRAYFIHLLNRKKTLTFRNETRCTTFLVKMSFICMRMKNHFHIKGWALNLVLIQRPGETRKWPIKLTNHIYFTKSLLLFPRPHFFKRRINKASLSSIKRLSKSSLLFFLVGYPTSILRRLLGRWATSCTEVRFAHF